jgi:hypothetical protein
MEQIHIAFLQIAALNLFLHLALVFCIANPGGCAAKGVRLWPLDCWDCGFESR